MERIIVGVAVEGTQHIESLGAEVEEHTGEDLFVSDGGMLHPVGHHVVDILDEDKVGMLFVEVLDKGSVSAGAEDETPLFVAQGVVLLVNGDDVGVMLLFRECYFEFYAKCVFVVLLSLRRKPLRCSGEMVKCRLTVLSEQRA